MTEVDGLEFVNRVTGREDEKEEYVLEAEDGAEMTVMLTEIDRQDLLDEINKLPEEMLDTLNQAEDEEEAQELAEEQNMLSSINGDVVDAFEEICALSMEKDGLTYHHFEQLVTELSFEVLFEMGSIVIEMSLGNQGHIKDFREAGTGRNS